MRTLHTSAKAARLAACSRQACAVAPSLVHPRALLADSSCVQSCALASSGGFSRYTGAFDSRRLCSSGAAATPPPPPQATDAHAPDPPASEQTPDCYVGPLAVTLRRVKLLSLSSLAVTTVGAPLLVHLSAPEAVSVAAKVALSGSVVAFGCFTTALLSYFASPYVLRLQLDSAGKAVTVTTLDLFARPQTVTLGVNEFREPQTLRPLATFAARGRIYFLDGNIADAELLARLGLQKKTVDAPQTGYDSDDEDEPEEKRRK